MPFPLYLSFSLARSLARTYLANMLLRIKSEDGRDFAGMKLLFCIVFEAVKEDEANSAGWQRRAEKKSREEEEDHCISLHPSLFRLLSQLGSIESLASI